MSAEILNLRRARKEKARAEKERQAAENRVRFGRTKTERVIRTAESERSARDLDAHRREDGAATRTDSASNDDNATS
ncbi:MAG: DUF4169 family protein [Hyphomicrobiaceae bacterium]|nr:DUF4169 family protein [Hyphomicrobiaceae bacterium]